MPRKKHNFNHLKGFTSTGTNISASSSDKAPKSVNQLLANFRTTSSSASSRQPPFPLATTPSVPPSIREILQIPETPSPAPRRPVRRRVDNNGRRLPAGPPPPRSWTTHNQHSSAGGNGNFYTQTLNAQALEAVVLPGAYLPSSDSLVGLAIQQLAFDWDFHKEYDGLYLYDMPSHLKPALMRTIGISGCPGLSVRDLKLLLVAPDPDIQAPDESEAEAAAPLADQQVMVLDLSGAIGRSMDINELSEFLFPRTAAIAEVPQESWDDDTNVPSPPRTLLPNLSHLSLAVNPQYAENVSWKQLLAIGTRFSTITHLSLAYWPVPCLARRSQFATLSSPQGKNIPYSGTNYYSHSIDNDWSEALLVLRILTKRFYALEFLDLTGCASWFKALLLEDKDSDDHVDWSGNWGKIRTLRLKVGWDLTAADLPSRHEAYREACRMAVAVEKRIVAMRAGKGRFITVETDKLDE